MTRVLFLLPVLASAMILPAADWPCFHGPSRDNTSPETGWNKEWPAEGPPVLWKKNVGRGLASCAIAGGRVYTTGNNGADEDAIVCLELDSGREIWRHAYACKTAAHPMSIVPYGPAATPSVSDGRVVTLSREGDLLCLKAETGAVIWRKHLVSDLQGKRPVYGYGGSVLADQGRLYLNVGGAEGSTVCLDAATGSVVWARGGGEAGYATPVLARLGDKTALVIFKGEALAILDPNSGTEWARHESTTRDYCNCATPFVLGGTVFISHTGDDGSTGLSFGGEKLTVAWNDRNLGLLFNSGVPWQNRLIVFNDQLRGVKDLRCVELASGKSLWIHSEIEKGTAILSDGHLLILSSNGELVLAKPGPEKLTELARLQALPGKSYVLPALSEGRLLCKNNAGDVVCLDLRRK